LTVDFPARIEGLDVFGSLFEIVIIAFNSNGALR
jgi:hypothetical protein